MKLNLRMLNYDADLGLSEGELESATSHLLSRLFIWGAVVESSKEDDPQGSHTANVEVHLKTVALGQFCLKALAQIDNQVTEMREQTKEVPPDLAELADKIDILLAPRDVA